MDEYQTFFNYKDSGSTLTNLIPIIIFILVGVGIVLNTKKIFKSYSLFRQIILFFGYTLGGFATLFLIIALIRMPRIVTNERDFSNMIESKSYNIVEGETENFSPMPIGENGKESFTVNGITFEYSDYIITKGFHQTSINNGPIKKNGQQVRITYYTTDHKNLILKIEIKNKH